jgi:hypothetical protein
MCVQTAGSSEVTAEVLGSLVAAVGLTATIQGQVRDEYVASESLSRV